MTPAEEDALVLQYSVEAGRAYVNAPISVSTAIRLAIRAAVAQERERAAKYCLMVYDDAMAMQKANGNSVNYYDLGRASAADMCRTHIVEGEP